MFKRRDIPPVLLLLLLIILVMLTLSQILVVHNGRYGKNVHTMRKLQLELREMDINLHTMMLQNVPSIELSRRQLQNEINAQKVARIMAEAALPDKRFVPSRRSSTHHHLSDPNVTTADESSLGIERTKQMQTSAIGMALEAHSRNIVISENQQHSQYNTTISLVNTSGTLSNVSQVQQSEAVVHNPSNNSVISTVKKQKSKTYCPPIPPLIQGHIFINIEHTDTYGEDDVIHQNPEVQLGGMWRPHDCMARHKVAVIIPYRDRNIHLNILLSHLHPMLQRQQLDYRIYVVEQFGEYTFNKARIMNIAFVEALKQYGFQCFVFHDVDLVPEDDRNMYSCPVQPRHMSVAIDEMGYKLAYQELVGGVLNMRTEHFQRVNGYSNLYWGWGAEDDDMAYRIMYVGLKITRPPESVARYKMIKHTKRKPSDWRKRAKLLYTGTRRFQFDGLNSLQYKLVGITNTKLYTHILVDIANHLRVSEVKQLRTDRIYLYLPILCNGIYLVIMFTLFIFISNFLELSTVFCLDVN